MLLRVAQRETSWTEPDIHTICVAEFSRKNGLPGFDLTPSVYQIAERTHATRAVAEHWAAGNLDRPMSGRRHVDLQGLGPEPTHAPLTGGPFTFIREAHRELRLETEEALRALITALRADLAARCVDQVTGDAIKDYVGDRLRAGDTEWTAFCSTSPKGAKWRRFEKRPPAAPTT